MSSDSDSDICDFTSSASKMMTKGLDEFRENYKKKKLKEEDQSKNQTETTLPDENEINNIHITTDGLNDTDEVSIQPNVADIQSRITNKLNQLSEEVEAIVGNKRRRKRKQKQSRPCTRSSKKNTCTNANKRKAEVVTLSSDEEIHPTASRQVEVNNLQNNQELNPIVTIRVLWKSVETHTFKIPKYHPLDCIPKYYIDKLKINPKLLFFTLDDRQINLEKDSFVSLRLDETKIIEGGILPESYLEDLPQSTIATNTKDSLHFKVQYSNRKNNEILVSCKKNDTMEIIFWQVSSSIKESIEKIKLYFDGNLLQPRSKVADLDLEEGDCFDLKIADT